MALTITVAGFDETSVLLYDSLSLKRNTLDFALKGPFVAAIGDIVTLSSPGDFPDWTGSVINSTARVFANRKGSGFENSITAINADALNLTTAAFDLSDNPAANTTTLFELEDGSGHILLQNGSGSYLTEGVLQYSYTELTYGTQQNTDLTNTISGSAVVEQPGLWAGMTVRVDSADMAVIWAGSGGTLTSTISQVTVRYQGAGGAPVPVYLVEFGNLLIFTDYLALH